MKTSLFSALLTMVLALSIWLANTLAQSTSQWGLPAGAKARIGKGLIYEIQLSPDGTRLAVASSIGIWLYNARTAAAIRLLAGQGIRCVSFSPDGSVLASGDETAAVRLWDSMSGELLKTLQGHTHFVSRVGFSPDGMTLASVAHWEGVIRLWDIATGEQLKALGGTLPSNLYSLAPPEDTIVVSGSIVAPDGKTVATAGGFDGTIRLWSVSTGEQQRTLTGHTKRVSSLSFSSDGKTLASGSWDGTIRLWDVMSGEHLKTLTGHTKEISRTSFSPDGKT
ncbi:MAG: WD40 repeat domain-containing protein, partial [Candidatus Poribacteria bacterium]|nr:WD40 repeat domain-containing protein [Candidatus Poribacteria bacterium]